MTPTKGLPLPPAIHSPHQRLHRFTVEQYERLGASGILKPGDRVELLEGWIVEKKTQNPPHAVTLDNTADALRPVLPTGWRTREQKPIKTWKSMPEPEVAVVRGPNKRYARRHPVPADIALVVEVSDSTLDEDRGPKQLVYARARLPIYWIVNLVQSQVEVYTDPKGGLDAHYRQRQDYALDELVPVVINGGKVGFVRVRDLLP
jgi:hypothetical protein